MDYSIGFGSHVAMGSRCADGPSLPFESYDLLIVLFGLGPWGSVQPWVSGLLQGFPPQVWSPYDRSRPRRLATPGRPLIYPFSLAGKKKKEFVEIARITLLTLQACNFLEVADNGRQCIGLFFLCG